MTSTQKEPRELKGEQTEQGEHENKNGEQINEQTGQTEPETPAPELAGQIAIKGFEDLEPGEDPERSEQAEAPKRKKARDSGALYFDDETGRIVDQDGNDIKDNPEALAEYDRIVKKLQPKIYNAIIKTSKSIDQLAAVYLILSSNKESGALFLDSLPQNKVEAVKAAAERQTQSAINAGKLQARAENVKSYLEKELKKEDYHGATLEALLYDRSPETLADPDDDKTKLLLQAIAEAEKAAHKATAEAAAVNAKRAETILYPLDKINNNAWNLLTGDTGGQLKITFDLLPKKPNLQATAIYSINFDDLGDNVKITKKLQPFDKRVYIAISALYNAGNNVISATQIYYAMGNTGTTPAQYQIEKINNSLSKMAGATITLDNKKEAEALKHRERFKYTASLLPIENITAFVNGKVTESAIHIFREPPLMTFAKERNEITTFDVKLLQSPLSKTDANLLIDDYLIERISRGKHSTNKSHRILFVTLYEHANITTAKQRERAQDKIKKYLDHYKKQAFFKRYTIQSDGITIYY